MIGNKYILDGNLRDVNNQSENIEIKNSIVVYEVFTCENSKAIFFDEHYDRMYKSIELKNLNIDDIPCKEKLENNINKLVEANSFTKNNIRLDLVFLGGSLEFYSLYFVKSIYPSIEQYKNGVSVGLCYGERNNPHAKIANSEIRKIANQKITDQNLFEVLLVDSENKITEGSRSNVFFVKDKIIYTPKSEKVLNGITRQKVIEIARNNNIRIEEVDMPQESIDDFESAFLTSTSMIVLPISNIGNVYFSVNNELVSSLYSSFLGL